MAENQIYIKMSEAKELHKGDFKGWLLDFLSFVKEPEKFIRAFPQWESVMKDPSVYEEYKTQPDLILSYTVRKYIFFHEKESDTPEKMTNMVRPFLETKKVVKYFNMNYFDLEDQRNVIFYSFIECLNQACIKLKMDVVDVMTRFVRIFFATNKEMVEERDFGPIKSRFFEVVDRMAGSKPKENPDRTLIIPESFFEKITETEKEELSKIVGEEIPMTDVEYYEAMKILKHYELQYQKPKYNSLFREVEGFSLVRSNNNNKEGAKYYYWIENNTGSVLKIFDQDLSLPVVVSEIKEIIR